MTKQPIPVKTPKGVQTSLVDLSSLGLSEKSSARVGKKTNQSSSY